jgi:hypothetical protein
MAMVVALAQCAGAQADDESLRNSFAEQVAASGFVTDFSRDGDEFTFSGPDAEDRPAAWRVRITSSFVEPNLFDEAVPFVGRITSEWYVNDELVEYLNTMSALPKKYLDLGVGQECWGNWIEAERRWDW